LIRAMEKRAFIFSMADGDNENIKDHRAFKDRLTAKVFHVFDEFTCRGFDMVGPLLLIGGINKGRQPYKMVSTLTTPAEYWSYK
jgi:hypothetical protein